MLMQISELSGAALDWAVAKCDQPQWSDEDAVMWVHDDEYGYNPSTDWSQGGPIIEREMISISSQTNGHDWAAKATHNYSYGQTPLITAMRCYCASKLGGEIELPDELI